MAEKKVLVPQSCPTLCNPMDCSLPGSSVCPWDSPTKKTEMSCHSLLQRIFPARRRNPGLLHCKHSLYCLSHLGCSTIRMHNLLEKARNQKSPLLSSTLFPIRVGIEGHEINQLDLVQLCKLMACGKVPEVDPHWVAADMNTLAPAAAHIFGSK